MRIPAINNYLIAGTVLITLIYLGACTQEKGKNKEPRKAAIQFIEAGELHMIYAEAMAAGYRERALRGPTPEKKVNCIVTKITPEMVLPFIADAFAMECSDDELRQATSFFESETGKTYVRYERMRVKEIIGMSTEEPPEYSPSEEEGIVAFEQSHVGKLVTAPDSSIRGVMREKLDPQFNDFYEQCKNVQ